MHVLAYGHKHSRLCSYCSKFLRSTYVFQARLHGFWKLGLFMWHMLPLAAKEVPLCKSIASAATQCAPPTECVLLPSCGIDHMCSSWGRAGGHACKSHQPASKMLLVRMFQLGKMPELRLGTLMATSAIWQQVGLVRQISSQCKAPRLGSNGATVPCARTAMISTSDMCPDNQFSNCHMRQASFFAPRNLLLWNRF